MLHYILTLTTPEYAELMKLVMRCGTGISNDEVGSTTSINLRKALSTPMYKTTKEEEFE